MSEEENYHENDFIDENIKNNQIKISSQLKLEQNINNYIENYNKNDNSFIFNQLKNKLSVITKENIFLKSEINSLRNKIINLKSDKVCQKANINDLIKTQNNLFSLKNLISEKDKTIETLKEQILSDHKKYNEELRYRESKFDYELIQSKVQYERAKYKIDNYLKIENYSDALYKQLLEMEEIINNFNKIEESNMNKQKIQYMNKLNKFKKKMLDFLKDEINCKDNFREQLKLNNFVNNLHVKELIKDIEDLNNEVCDLLEEKQELKYKIFCLVNDIEIYRKVIDTVVLKNNHLQNRLFKKNTSSPIMEFNKFFKDKKNIKNNSDNEIIDPKKETNKKLMKISNSLSLLLEKNNKKNNINSIFNKKNESVNTFNSASINKFNSTTYFNSHKNQLNNNNLNELKNKNSYYLFDTISELIKEKDKYKQNYENYKYKYNLIKEKYTFIFKIYEEALEKIFNEDLKKEKNDIFINLNDFKNFEFNYEEMNAKEKYFILIKLIKYISPLIYKKEFENNKFTEQIFNVKEKYSLGNNNTKSLSFSTDQNSLDISLKLKNKYFNVNKKTCSLKIYDRKHIKLSNILRNKNKQKIFIEFKKNFNIVPVPPFKSIPINDFYNGPFSSI